MSAAALELQGVQKRFGATEIVQGVDLRVEKGERHALIGPNGAGKSVLFHLISARYPVSAGTIMLHGEPITGLKPHEINRRGLARSFQVTNLFHRMSVFENVRCAALWSLGYGYAFWRRVDRLADANARAAQIVERVGLASRSNVSAGILSYAEQRALEIGVAIAGGADVILLDEPTAGMSRTETEAAVDLIRRVTEGRTLLIVEHDMSVVFGLADRISVLVYGRVVATGTPEEIRGNARVREAYLGADAHA
ncbi:MAG TPA: ABC transporter ATP-binding protein [Usitatibacter sp.]|nr:ABC transporter ATP-binding protein [Usitatibacter sp.]